MAKDLGFHGIEIRGLGDEIFGGKTQPFLTNRIEKTKETLRKRSIEIPCFSSGCCLKYKERMEDNIAEITRYIALAEQMGASYVRVLGDIEPAPDGTDVDDSAVVAALNALKGIAAKAKVTLLVETNGVYADTKRLKALLDEVNSPAVAALWDTHHPYRYFSENPADTVANIGKYIRYVHVKDSVDTDGRITYKLMGEGTMPIETMLSELVSIGYDGYITLEWVKRWAAELEEAGIVFPHFARFMQPYLTAKKQLFRNRANTGDYLWVKDSLIDETFPDILDRVCEEFPDQYAFRFIENGYCRTYTQFRDDVDAFALTLIGMGVGKGDHVAVWATNVPAWYITFWATVKIGAVLVTMNTAYKIHEAEYLLRQSDTHTLVMLDGFRDSDYLGIIKEVCPELADCQLGKLNSKRLPCLRNVVLIDGNGSEPGCHAFKVCMDMGYEYKMNGVHTDRLEARRRATSKHDICNMQYTSGTTGFPKGVMLTHYNVVNNGKVIGDCMDLSTADKLMIQVPMFHCFGLVLAMTAAMTHGATMCPITAFSPAKGLDCINKEGITAFHGVPTMFIAMLEHENFANTDFSHVRTGIMAGSPCPVKVMEDVLTKMSMSEVCITYGQTEASPAITMSSTTDSVETRVGTVGGPVFGVEVKIVDAETGEDLPDNVPGELCARGYNIMKGYYKMPEATASAIDADGWLHTGDVAVRLSDGYYKITGRIGDMIIRGGENIYPKEIEDFMYKHPKIRDVQVIGVPSEAYGEEIMACVILKDGETATEQEIKDFVLASMAKHKVPSYVGFVESFPMNAAGKILKYKMREWAVNELGLQAASKIVTA